jgi:hypothetical protein
MIVPAKVRLGASPIGLSQAVDYAGGPGLPVEVPEFGATERSTAEHWIKEGKGAITWTRLSCRGFDANAVRLPLHVLAYNRGNFVRSLALPKAAERDGRSLPRHSPSGAL